MRSGGKGATSLAVGGKLGSGRKGLKRLKLRSLDGSSALNRPSLRRLARRAGVKRISLGVYDEAPTALRTWLSKIIRDACTYTEHAKRMTVVVNDVLHALKRNGLTLYGFGERAERRRRIVQPLARQDLAAAAQRLTTARRTSITPSPAPAPARPAAVAAKRNQTLTAAAAQRVASRKPQAPARRMNISEPEKNSGAAPAAAPAGNTNEDVHVDASLEVSPERSMEIQQAFAAFRDTVIARQQSSSADVSRAVEWAGAFLRGQGKDACSVDEAQVVLGALQTKDAVQLEDGGNTVWFL